jgi:hypothetical protein
MSLYFFSVFITKCKKKKIQSLYLYDDDKDFGFELIGGAETYRRGKFLVELKFEDNYNYIIT